jgi:hypothetical protein
MTGLLVTPTPTRVQSLKETLQITQMIQLSLLHPYLASGGH